MTENDLNYFFGVDNHLQGRKTGLILAKVVMKIVSIVVHFPEVSWFKFLGSKMSISLTFYECASE